MIHEILHSLLVALVSAFGLIVLAKIILSKLIRKEPDYYEKDEVREEYEMLVRAGIIHQGPEEPAAVTEEPAETPEEAAVIAEPAEEPAAVTEEPAEAPEEAAAVIEEPAEVPEEPAAAAAALAETPAARVTDHAPKRTVYAVLTTYDPATRRAVIADYWRADGKEGRA